MLVGKLHKLGQANQAVHSVTHWVNRKSLRKQAKALHSATHYAHSVPDQKTMSKNWFAGDANAVANLKTIFNRMGLSTQQLVALFGAHYIARWGRESSTDPELFDKHYRDLSKRFSNAYFRQAVTSVC